MRKLVIIVILAALGGGGYYGYQRIFVPPPEKIQVIQTTVSQGNILDVVKATGTLQPLRTSPVGSQVSGVVKKLYVDFNSIVKKDMVIAELDDQLLRTQVQLQTASLERQQGEIASQEVQLENDRKNLERQEALFKKDLLNQQAIDTARLQVKTRETSLNSAKKQLLTVQAALDQAKLNLSYAVIRSPIDGVVVNRQVDEGQTVQSSVNVAQFFTLATDLRTLKLQAWVDEADIGKIRPGMSVQFTVDSYGREPFSGTVDAVRLNAQNTNNVVTYPVWIEVPNPQLKLRPSMTATLDIILSEATGVIRVPMTATRFRPNADIYAALGAQAPAAGQGTRLAGGGAPGAAAPGAGAGRDGARTGQPPAAGEQPAASDAAAGGNGRRARGGGGGGRGGGGRGFGAQGGATMTAEDQARLRAQFGAAGGGRGGRGGRGSASNETATPVDLTSATQIDELWAPVLRPSVNLNVWTWDEANKKLTQIPVQVGVSDGQFGELLSGNIKVGDRLVTTVIIPQTSAQRNQQNQSLFGNQQRGGRGGGPQPGGGGGAPVGGGGRGGGGEGGGGGGGRGGGVAF